MPNVSLPVHGKNGCFTDPKQQTTMFSPCQHDLGVMEFAHAKEGENKAHTCALHRPYQAMVKVSFEAFPQSAEFPQTCDLDFCSMLV